MKPKEVNIEKGEKRNKKPEYELEDYPLERAFTMFIEKIMQLKAEHDKVGGIHREYISTSQLMPAYQDSFGEAALVPNTINYRILHIRPEEFPDDFLSLDKDRGKWVAKYFVNRLNHELLKKIYLPQVESGLQHLVKKIALEEDFLRTQELDEEDQEEEI